MSKIGVLVANGSHAKFIHYHGAHQAIPLEIIAEFNHPESRAKCNELVSDKPGHYHSQQQFRGAYGEDRNPKEISKEHFAIELAKKLEHYRTQDQFNKFLIITPAHFLGLLEKHLSKEISTTLYGTIQKDYT